MATDVCKECGQLGEEPYGLVRGKCVHCRTARTVARMAANGLKHKVREAEKAASTPKSRAGYTPTQRMLALLALLREHRHKAAPAVTTDQIRDRVPAYAGDDEASRKRLQRDISVLASRGIVERCVTDDYLADNRDGVRLVEELKPEIYELTAEEHDAIAQARRALRPGPLAPALPDGPPDKHAADIDLHMRLLRAVEEHHDQLPLDELAGLLGTTRAKTIEALRALDDLRGTGAFTGLTAVYDDRDLTDDEIDRGDDIEAVMIIRPAERPRRNPLLGLGLDELGRFAYTWHECEDRLDLIRTALQTWAPEHAPHLAEHLHNAKFKLINWQNELPEPASARAEEAS